ncbi:MAG: DUF5703 domain-containing protein, partial [Planctomycetota bacterium]
MARLVCRLVAGVGLLCCSPALAQHPHDVVWTSPSGDNRGSMPLGNGDIGLNAWVDPRGDLVFLIGKTDSWSDNGRLLKLGRVRIALSPAPVLRPFEQRLDLQAGTMVARCGDGDDATVIRLWVDANHPVVHASVESRREVTATASIELWRTERQPYPASEVSDLLEDRSKPNRLHEEVFVEPDTIIEDLPDRIGWYHHNVKSVGPALTARLQGLSEYYRDKPDPLLHRTFGAVIGAEGGERIDDTHLRSPAGRRHRFSVYVRTEHPSSPTEWLDAVRSLAAAVERVPFEARRAAHAQWWAAFWSRSHIRVSEATPARPVPRNAHPVRIGMDQHGENRFVGSIGRVTIVPRALSPARLGDLARTGHDRPLPPVQDALYRDRPAPRATINGSAGWTFDDGLTIEAWVKPGALPDGGGRIVDKTTPGVSDGLLLDTYPGRSLRFIAGPAVLSRTAVLPKGTWSHVAASLDRRSGRMALFLDGREIASTVVDVASDAAVVSRAYALQRYVDACAGRGRYPIKFNGSIFTVPFEGTFGEADYRRWGPGYWWQNTRLPYLSMCASGDFEMMRPLFRMYADELMPLHVFRTRRYTGHAGAFIPECIYFWGPTFTATYGWTPFEERGEDKLQESGWHKREWVSGLELVWMMLDSYEHTLDERFLAESLLPAAHEVLTFFDRHYGTDDRGRLVMHPSQALETWWDCTNPMPEVAGLHAVTQRLLALPEQRTTSGQRAFWTALRAKLPPLPTRDVDGVSMLAPAERFDQKRNVENPELYAVFPFRLVSFEKPNAPLGVAALEHRWDRGSFGWRQDDLFMSHLGLADQARAHLVSRARNTHAGSRFPVFWGPNYDWVPDQDHGGVLMRTLQTMLMQTEGKAIHLLPAWPEAWEADFKLHAPYRTVVSGRVRDGRVEDLQVVPESRRRDVIIHAAATATATAPAPPPGLTVLPRYAPVPDTVAGVDQASVSLDGTWRFTPALDENDTRPDTTGWADVPVPGQWVQAGFEVPEGRWAGYARSFDVPPAWLDHRVMIRFEAVFSACTVYVNGRRVGEHEGGFTAFDVDATAAVQARRNDLLVRVTGRTDVDRLASASQYAVHDLGGITRPVTLFALPETHLAALRVRSDLDEGYRNAMVSVTVEVAGPPAAQPRSVRAVLVEPGPSARIVADSRQRLPRPGPATIPLAVPSPRLWDPEHPVLYELRLQVREGDDLLQTVTRRIGIREIEVRGAQLLINGRPVMLRGVNRHVIHPFDGRVVSVELARRDATLFRDANVNFIRTSHYPPTRAFLEACDELGLLVECEAPICWLGPLVRQNLENVAFNANHPSVVLWSLANESAWSDLWAETLAAVLDADPSRPAAFHDQCWGGFNNFGSTAPIANMHYPGPDFASASAAESRPVLFGEHTHLNAYNRRELLSDPGLRDAWGGLLRHMWERMRADGHVIGGAIWSGIDDLFVMPDGTTVGYGEWGPVDAYRREKPEYWHLKKVYSPIRAALTAAGRLAVENRHDFTDLAELAIGWRRGDRAGTLELALPPRSRGAFDLPGEALFGSDPLELRFRSPHGFEIDRFVLGAGRPPADTMRPEPVGAVRERREGSAVVVSSGDVSFRVDTETGAFLGLFLGDRPVLQSGLHFMLIPLNGEGDTQMTPGMAPPQPFDPICGGWSTDGVTTTAQPDGAVRVEIAWRYDQLEGRYGLELD